MRGGRGDEREGGEGMRERREKYGVLGWMIGGRGGREEKG